MNDLPFVILNAELSDHYESHTYFSKRYNGLFGWNVFILLYTSMNVMALLVYGYPLLQATVMVLISAMASIADTVLIIRAPYPPDAVFHKHGVPVIFIPLWQTAAKVFIACGRVAAAGAKASIVVMSTLSG